MAFLSLLHLYLSGYCGYSDGATAILQGLIEQTYSSMDYICSIFVVHTISAQKSICSRKIEQTQALCRQTYYSDYSTVTSSDSQVTSSLIGVIHFPLSSSYSPDRPDNINQPRLVSAEFVAQTSYHFSSTSLSFPYLYTNTKHSAPNGNKNPLVPHTTTVPPDRYRASFCAPSFSLCAPI